MTRTTHTARDEKSLEPAFCFAQPTEFGDILLIWQNKLRDQIANQKAGSVGSVVQLCRIYLPDEGSPRLKEASADFPSLEGWAASTPLPARIEEVIELLLDILAGKSVLIPDELGTAMLAALASLPAFYKNALLAASSIPYGTCVSYRGLAQACGNPKAARAIANALAHNPFPLLIPCHRVYCIRWKLGGYQGGIVMKRALLERERSIK